MKFRYSIVLAVFLLVGCSDAEDTTNCVPTAEAPGTESGALLSGPDCPESGDGVPSSDQPAAGELSFGSAGDASAISEEADAQSNDPRDNLPDGMFCVPGTTDCVSETTKGVCKEDGSGFQQQQCPSGFGCLAGECTESSCVPGEEKGECASTYEYLVCNEGGTAYDPVSCEGGLTCYQGKCESFVCVPNSTICVGTGGFKTCDGAGGGYSEPQLCPEGSSCQNNGAFGECVDACEANVKANIYLGCDYFAVDLDNVDTAADENVGIVVSVPATETKTATVTVTELASGNDLTATSLQTVGDENDAVIVEPGQLKTLLLPTNGITGSNPLNGSVKTKAAYAISSDVPVTVHQFNPLNGEGVYTNDASLLFPSNLGGIEYLVMSWPHRVVEAGGEELRGYAAVIATEDGETEVTVIPRSNISPGVGVPAIAAGESRSFTLQKGDVLNLESDGETGADITGTWIRSSQKVTVMSGHECANVPLGVNYCDHLEQQLFPLNTWGQVYIADAYQPRNEKQFDVWRVMGGADNTQVTTSPPIPGYETFTVHKGTIVEFQSSESFSLSATGPILVGHYMIGSNYPGYSVECTEGSVQSGIGDPALALSVPTEQYLKEYVVLTPPGYEKNYINVIIPTGAEVNLDGAPITETPVSIPGTGYDLIRVVLEPGVHTVDSSVEFGLTAYGYDCDVSYAYPGGLKLQALTE